MPISNTETAQEDTASDQTPGFSFSVDTLGVRAASLTAEDRTTQPAANFVLPPLSLSVSGYRNEAGNVVQIDASGTLNESGTYSANGSVQLDNLASALTIAVENIDLVPLQPYIRQMTSMELLRGQLSGSVDLAMNESTDANQPQLQLTGDIAVADLATRDLAMREDFINWERLELNGLQYTQAPDAFGVETVRAVKPYGKVVISQNQTLNAMEVLKPATAGTSAGAANANANQGARMPIRIGRVVVEDGALDFSDFFIEPNFSADVENLDGSVTGLSSAANSRAEVDLTGSVGGYAPVDIAGQVNFLSTATYTDLAMNFRNIELTTFNPYSGKYAGYNIRQGKLLTELNYKIEDRAVDLQHHIVLDQLEFGDATDSTDAVPLPIQLAVALLKDSNGVIDLDLPVSGSLDDPEFRVGPIIWQAFTGLLTRIVTAPFAILGALVGGGEELAIVEFAAGSSALSASQAEKLEMLSAALVERPQLRLEIPLETLIDADDTALSESAYNNALAAITVPPPPEPSLWQRLSGPPEPPTEDEEHLAALTQLYLEAMGAPPAFPVPESEQIDSVPINIAFLEEILRAHFSVTAEQRDQLAMARAETVRAAILANEAMLPERVFLVARGSGEADGDIARMELSLE